MCALYFVGYTEGPVLCKRQTTLSQFLSVPELSTKKSFQPKSSARVLTSLENLQQIEERERKKKEKDTLKRERQRKREEKQMLKHSRQGLYLHAGLYIICSCYMYMYVYVVLGL